MAQEIRLRTYAAAGPGPSSKGYSSPWTGARNRSRITFGPVRLTRSTLTMCVHPSVKKGLWLPALRPISAAPSGDNTGMWVFSDLSSSG